MWNRKKSKIHLVYIKAFKKWQKCIFSHENFNVLYINITDLINLLLNYNLLRTLHAASYRSFRHVDGYSS